MKRATQLLAIAGVTLLGANAANAGFSTIGASINPAEPTQAAILSTLYGGAFAADGVNFSNGSVTATRIDDNLDTVWTDSGDPTEVASYTSLAHTVTYGDDKYTLTRAGATFTSDPADNVDGMDHMITYLLSGAQTGYVLFFEDGNAMKGADFDFNDVVLASTGSPVLVPLPGAMAMGLVGLGTLGVGKLARKFRKTA